MNERMRPHYVATRAPRIGLALTVVVAVIATGLSVPLGKTRAAHADVPVAQPSNCVFSGSMVFCNGIPILPPPSPFPPPLQVSGNAERLVRGQAAAAWLPLEREAKAATAEFHQVPNDNRLLATARDTMRSYMFFRLLDMIDSRARGMTLSAEDHAALSAFEAAATAHKTVAANKAIEEYDRWFTNRCNGYQPPAGFEFEPYDTAGGCTPAGQIFGGGPPPPTVEQFEAYGAALAFQSFTSSADAQAAIEDLNFGLAFAEGIVGAVAGAITAGAITASSAALSDAIVRTALPHAFRALTRSLPQITGLAVRSVSQVAGVGAAAASTVVGVILFAAAVTAIGGVVFSENASVRTKLEEARNQVSVDLNELAGTTEGEALLLAVLIDQTLPDLAAERAALVPTPPVQPPGEPQWTVTTPTAPAGTTHAVLTNLNWTGQPQQTFVTAGYFITSVAGGPWVRSLTLDYLGPRVVADQFGQRRILSIRGSKLYDHAAELPAPGGIAVIEEPVLVDSFRFVPSLSGVPFPPSTDPGPVHTAGLTGNRPPMISGGSTFYMFEDQTTLTVSAPGVFSTVTDQDSDPLTVTGVNQPSSGNVIVVNATGNFVYTRAPGAPLPVQFDVTISDGRGGSVLVPVTIGLNRVPSVDTGLTLITPGAATYLCPARDPDGDGLTLAVTGAPQRGTAIPQFGCFLFVPNAGALGLDRFTFSASDGKGGAATGTVELLIGVPPRVRFVDPPFTVPEDTDVEFRLDVFSGEGTVTPQSSCGSDGSLVGATAATFTCRWEEPNAGQFVSTAVVNPSGLGATAAIFVTVTDATPPSWSTFPPDIEVAADSPNGSIVTYAAPTATDVASPPVAIVCSHASGALFPIGTTTVGCAARDAVDNPTIRTFSVKVNPYVAPPPPVQRVRDYAPVFSTSSLRTAPRSLRGATVRGAIGVWPNLPLVAPGQPTPVAVEYQLIGPRGRGITTTTIASSVSPFDLAGRNVTGHANLRRFERGVWKLVVTVTSSDNSTVTRAAVFKVR